MNNPLAELIPAKGRKYVYGLVALAALVYGAWQVSGGNVEVFVGALIAALTSALALSNTPASRPEIEEAAEELVEEEPYVGEHVAEDEA